MRTFVIANGSSKSWAFGIEVAYREALKSQNVIFLDVSKLTSSRLLSFSRKKFTRNFCKKYRIELFEFKSFSRIGITAFLLTLRNIKHFFITADFNFSFNEKISTNEIVRARLSQTLGTPFFDNRDVPLSLLFKYLFQIYCSERLANNFSINKSDNLIVFNGREPIEATWIAIAKNFSSKVLITERASSRSKFETYNISPHFHPEWWQKIEKFSKGDDFSKLEIMKASSDYLKNKVEGYDSFLGQKWNQFYYDNPRKISLSSKSYIVFFTTSSHEYSPILDFNSDLGYKNQFDALKDLSKICKSLNYHLVIRRHPNSISPLDQKDRENKIWEQYTDENTTVIDPLDRVNSLELASDARVVFVWRSGIGIETINLGVPTYALGTAKWALDESVRCWTPSKIREAILDPKMYPLELLSKYLAYMSSGGERLSIFKYVDRWGVTLPNGKVIFNYLLERTITRLSDFTVLFRKNKVKRKI